MKSTRARQNKKYAFTVDQRNQSYYYPHSTATCCSTLQSSPLRPRRRHDAECALIFEHQHDMSAMIQRSVETSL
jgi:hypothetical protein